MDTFVYTVTQLSNHSKSILENNLKDIWVSGEIISFKIYGSGHAYFLIKDDNSELSCTWFNYPTYNNLVDGVKVTLNGKVTLYNKKAKFQFQVKSAFLDGEGSQSKKLIELKNKLFNEGLFDIKYKKKLPKYPSNIAVVSSIQGAVIKDIINIYNRRAPYLKLFLYDVNVQGDKSSNMIIEVLKSIEIQDNIDLLIIARGGGSNEDLNVFNDESLVRSIFDCNIPVVTAIGHEIDNTLVDLVADYRASTPSEAAEISVPDISNLVKYIDEVFLKICSNSNNQIKYLSLNVDHNKFLSSLDKTLMIIDANILSLDSLFRTIKNKLLTKLETFKNNFISCYKVIRKNNLETLKKIGLSVVRKEGKVIIDSKNIHVNDKLIIDMYDGDISIKVGEVIKNEE